MISRGRWGQIEKKKKRSEVEGRKAKTKKEKWSSEREKVVQIGRNWGLFEAKLEGYLESQSTCVFGHQKVCQVDEIGHG